MIYRKHKDNKKKPALMLKIASKAIGGWKLATARAANKSLQVPWILHCDNVWSYPWHFEHFLQQKQVTEKDVSDTLQGMKKSSVALATLMQRVIETAVARLRRAKAAAAGAGAAADGQGSSDGMSLDGSQNSSLSGSGTMSLDGSGTMSLGGSNSSSEGGGGRQKIQSLKHKGFGVLGQKRTVTQMLNACAENIRYWTPQVGDTDIDTFQLLSIEGGEARYYKVLSSRLEGTMGIWTVQMLGTDQTRTWSAMQMAYALEAASLGGTGQENMPPPGELHQSLVEGQNQLGQKPPHHSDFNQADAATMVRMEKEATEIQAGLHGDDGAATQLGYNMKELRSAADFVKVSSELEYLTEKECRKQYPALTRCYGVLAILLNRRWGGTYVTAWCLLLVSFFSFGRAANDRADKLSFEFSLTSFVAGKKKGQSGPLSTQKAEKHDTMRMVDGDLVSVPAPKAEAHPSILGSCSCLCFCFLRRLGVPPGRPSRAPSRALPPLGELLAALIALVASTSTVFISPVNFSSTCSTRSLEIAASCSRLMTCLKPVKVCFGFTASALGMTWLRKM
jgi:hypothetical protein